MDSNFLRNALQNYIQFDVELPIVISTNITINENDNDLVIWKGDMNEIIIGTRDEFILNKKMSNSDYRIDDDSIIYETSDKDKITLITDSVVEGFINKYSYERMIDDLIQNTSDNKSLKI